MLTRRTKAALICVLAVFFLVGVGSIFYDRYRIVSDSMNPTLESGDKIFTRSKDPGINDIIAFGKPGPVTGPSTTLVSRLVAVGGQEITIADGHLWIDGVRIVEPFLNEPASTRARLTIPGCAQEEPAADRCVIPDGFGFVMGDNRLGSSDSRVYGPVDLGTVQGVVGNPPFWLLIEYLPF